MCIFHYHLPLHNFPVTQCKYHSKQGNIPMYIVYIYYFNQQLCSLLVCFDICLSYPNSILIDTWYTFHKYLLEHSWLEATDIWNYCQDNNRIGMMCTCSLCYQLLYSKEGVAGIDHMMLNNNPFCIICNFHHYRHSGSLKESSRNLY